MKFAQHLVPEILQDGSHWARNPELAGAKAARLAQLCRLGLPVPPFVVLSTVACSRYFKDGLDADREVLPAKIEAALLRLPGSRQGTRRYAVRSSSPVEDQQQHSFAGLFISLLDIERSDLAKACASCWHSLHRDAALSAFKWTGSMTQPPRMAVIIQEMINPDFAGVLFTRHPLRTDQESYYLEIVPGIGESLVSGEREPARLELSRQAADLPEKAAAAGLPSAALEKLVGAARRIEAMYKYPQDIEFAIAGDALFILQTRPISRAGSSRRLLLMANGRAMTDFFFAERFVEPLSPLGWSFLRPLIERTAFRDPLWYLGNDAMAKSTVPLLRLVHGRPFADWQAFQALYAPVPAAVLSLDKRLFLKGSSSRFSTLRSALESAPFLLSRLVFRDNNWLPRRHLAHWGRFYARCQSEMLRTQKLPADPDRAQALWQQCEGWTADLLRLHRWSLLFADLYYKLLIHFLQRFIDAGRSEIMAADLLSGLDNNQTLAVNRELHLLAKLHEKKSAGAWRHFMRNYGHRAQSLDIAKATWREDPGPVRDYLHLIRTAPDRFLSGEERRRQTECRCRESLGSSHTRLAAIALNNCFSYILENARAFGSLRENQRDLWHRILALTRSAALEMGRILAGRQLLADEEEVFWLTRKELMQAIQPSSMYDYRPLVQDRRRLLAGDPGQRQASGTNEAHAAYAAGTHTSRGAALRGIGVSAGIAAGCAFIAHSYEEARKVPPQSILVVRSVDPAWTPLFTSLSGLVLEVGGVLSHAAILAREFGLPAITSVEGATSRIKTGDSLVLDGLSGTVTIEQLETGNKI